MSRARIFKALMWVAFFFLSSTCFGQTVSTVDQATIINKVLSELRANYPFPEITRKMEAAIDANVKSGVYAKLANPEPFAGRLTQDLQQISGDRHIAVFYSPEKQKVEPMKFDSMYPPSSEIPTMEKKGRASNYGTSELRILQGNVGYMKFEQLSMLEFAADLYSAMMRYVAKTDALIIDLRQCGGGQSLDDIPYLAGYFFEHPVHLTDFYLGTAKTPRQLWSFAHVPGPRYLKKPVYMLISRATFSGCEAFAYEMQAQKRATVIGEVSGGGGNPNAGYPIDEHFGLSVPIARVVNPVTGTNWNEKGVQPDIAVPQAEALYRAHVAAVDGLQAKAPAKEKERFADTLDEIKANPPRIQQVEFKLPGHENADNVTLLASFNGYAPWANPLQKKNGQWTATVSVTPGRHSYLFLVDGEQVLDPANPEMSKDKRRNFLKVN